MSSTPIIVALDGMDPQQALKMAAELSGQGVIFKVHSAYDQPGGSTPFLKELSQHGQVMLDMKVHDIPRACAGRVRSLFQHPGVGIVTIHLSAGKAALEAAVKATPEGKILAGITVLTSLDEKDLRAMNIFVEPAEQVMTLAKLAAECGIRAIVCSPQEVSRLKSEPETTHLRLITPGITPTFAQKASGQKRTTSPLEAVQAGSDFLVIGSGITKQPDPLQALKIIHEEIKS